MSTRKSIESIDKELDLLTDIPQEELRWSSIKVNEVVNKDYRIDASTFDIEGKHAREVLNGCKWELRNLTGLDGIADAFHRPRFKRIWVEKSEIPIYQPAQVNEINPRPSGYLSDNTNTNIDSLRVKKGQILLTCSGTIGNSTLVGETLHNKVFSHDLIRIQPKDELFSGYIYAYLNTKIGRTLVNTNNYGAVISHIEPHHLDQIKIPVADLDIVKNISDLVNESFVYRDKSNQLLELADKLMKDEMELPTLVQLNSYDTNELKVTNVKLSDLDNRFEGSYHSKLVENIYKHFKSKNISLKKISENELECNVFLAGRFKRTYVDEGQGTVFFGGKQLYELDPTNKKFLSTKHHGERLRNELIVKENTILITCSGTIGKVTLAPKHWDGWAINQHVARIVCSNKDLVGYLAVFLSSDYGREIIRRYTYGAVVDEIDANHIKDISIPFLKNKNVQSEINQLALTAKDLRYQAYKKEQEAISLFNNLVIHS